MKIPTTVLGGFLGAGKTTALNALLRHAPHGIAVIVNDFGAINVDAELIETRDGGFMVAISAVRLPAWRRWRRHRRRSSSKPAVCPIPGASRSS
jgi:hypothetical protein